MTKPLSQQVADLESRIHALEYLNEMHKTIIYRLVATHGNRIELAKYSIDKGKAITKMHYSIWHGCLAFWESDNVNSKSITPNNSENEI